MFGKSLFRPTPARVALLAVIIGLLAAALRARPAVSATRRDAARPKPTIVLVHGAWAGPSSWNGIVERLQARGYTVIAPSDPLQGVQTDAAYLRSVLATISGPIVLVGHSYGGMVITNAATGNPNVKALVYFDAFAPAQGESVNSIEGINPGSELAANTVTVRPSPEGDEIYIDPSAYRSVFCADLPAKEAAVLAATQEPLNVAAETETSGPPAWKTIPSWYMVGTRDEAIPPATQLFMAKRAHSTIVEVPASHVSMISHPGAATRLIVEAADSVG